MISQLVKNPPAMQETLVSYLGQENLPSYHTKGGGVEGHVLIFYCENPRMTTHC